MAITECSLSLLWRELSLTRLYFYLCLCSVQLVSKYFYNTFYDTLTSIEIDHGHTQNLYFNAILRASFLQELVVRKYYPELMEAIFPFLRVQTLKVFTRGLIDDHLARLSKVLPTLTQSFGHSWKALIGDPSHKAYHTWQRHFE